MAINCYLSVDEKGKSIDQSKYGGIIVSLLYLTISGSEIMFSVFMCVRYQSSHKESHFFAIKMIINTLKEL